MTDIPSTQVNTDELKALGVSKDNNEGMYNQAGVDPALLEAFETPSRDETNPNGCELLVSIVAPEFTSLCPLTGQPDFAAIQVEYVPNEKCVESKSIKLYLGSFRNHGEFHESCVNRICNDLVSLLDPKWIRVVGFFTPRGGVCFHPTAVWSQQGFELPSELAARLSDSPKAPFAATA